MMSTFPDVYTLDLTPTEDGLVYVSGNRDVTAAFSAEAPLAQVIDWASDRPAFTLKQRYFQNQPVLGIRFDNTTGMIYLRAPNGTEVKFDPHSDEALARLVRRIKAHAPVADHTPNQPTLPHLPEPTPEQLANRTIYSNVGVPDGVNGRGRSRPKSRYQEPRASAAKTQKIVNEILSELFDL